MTSRTREPTVVATEEPSASGPAAERLSKGNAPVKALLALADELATADNPEVALERWSTWARRVIPQCAEIGLALRGSAEGELEVHSGSPSRTLAERAMSARRALLLAAIDLQDVSSASGRPQVMVAPLGELGAVQLDARADGAFSLKELDLMAVAARYAAQALERLALVERLRAAEQHLRTENRILWRRQSRGGLLASRAPAFARILTDLERVAPTTTTVLLQGETGVGKELVARYVHERSARKDKAFVPVNCGAMTETLLESELFGHKKGAFSGADADRRGIFEVASGGTVFLDEIGETPPALQVRLLRVLQEGTIRPVGEPMERKVDVRIVAATNRDLRELVASGAFRKDLFYRLSVFPLRVPPLRERKEDLPELVQVLLRELAIELGRAVPAVPPEVMDLLLAHSWPGNVRELMNELERALVRMAPEETSLSPELFSEEVQAAQAAAPPGTDLRSQVNAFERRLLEETLARHGGRRSAAAAALGLTRQGLAKKLERLGLAASQEEG